MNRLRLKLQLPFATATASHRKLIPHNSKLTAPLYHRASRRHDPVNSRPIHAKGEDKGFNANRPGSLWCLSPL
jgi:hypothetical protein